MILIRGFATWHACRQGKKIFPHRALERGQITRKFEPESLFVFMVTGRQAESGRYLTMCDDLLCSFLWSMQEFSLRAPSLAIVYNNNNDLLHV